MDRKHRVLVTLATGAVVALGATAPAYGSDVPAPPPPPAVPVPELPTIPVPELPPELVEPPEIVAEVDADGIDVSVDVLPTGDEDDGQPDASQPVVSPATEGDITPSADPVDGTAGENAPVADDAGVNTNVSIRVLSPGTSAGANQSAAVVADERAEGDPEREPTGADPAPADERADEAAEDSEQYRADNSQYQSESNIDREPWSWAWTLTVDCAGNATSSSLDSGDPASLEWAWEWDWAWGCAETAAPPAEESSTGERAPPAAEPRPPPERETTSSAGSDAASSEPWSWTWTFTFCGKTTEITTQAGTGTPLTWTWDWIWVWSCPTAATAESSAPPAIPTTTTPATSPATPNEEAPGTASEPSSDTRTIQASTPTLGPLTSTTFTLDTRLLTFATFTFDTRLLTFDAGLVTTTLELPTAPNGPLGIAIDVAIAPAIPPLETGLGSIVPPADVPFPPPAAPRGRTSTALSSSPPRPPATWTIPTRGLPAPSHEPAVRPHDDDAKQKSSPRVARARSASTPTIPVLPGPRHGAASTSASAGASGALLVGVAALTGLFLLAAPRIGRRIRVARELSPRSLDRSPIDHPG